jgi:hypothetical protein
MVSVDGIYIKRMLQLREEMSEEMGNGVVRVPRNGEADKRAETDGNVHYVMHTWAVRPLLLHTIYFFNPDWAVCPETKTVAPIIYISNTWAVCPETIYLAKLTFMYKGTIAAYSITKKTARKGRRC